MIEKIKNSTEEIFKDTGISLSSKPDRIIDRLGYPNYKSPNNEEIVWAFSDEGEQFKLAYEGDKIDLSKDVVDFNIHTKSGDKSQGLKIRSKISKYL